MRAFGLDVVTQLCERLVKVGAPGLHFYTLTAATATEAICERLGRGAHEKKKGKELMSVLTATSVVVGTRRTRLGRSNAW
jgi:hypothetical protein